MRASTLVWIVSMASMFTFLSVFWWALQRRREREAYYQYELTRLLLERSSGNDQQDRFLAWLEQQEEREERRRRHALMLTAAVLIATGLGFLVPLRDELFHEDAILGWISLFIGLAVVVHLVITRIKVEKQESESRSPAARRP